MKRNFGKKGKDRGRQDSKVESVYYLIENKTGNMLAYAPEFESIEKLRASYQAEGTPCTIEHVIEGIPKAA